MFSVPSSGNRFYQLSKNVSLSDDGGAERAFQQGFDSAVTKVTIPGKVDIRFYDAAQALGPKDKPHQSVVSDFTQYRIPVGPKKKFGGLFKRKRYISNSEYKSLVSDPDREKNIVHNRNKMRSVSEKDIRNISNAAEYDLEDAYLRAQDLHDELTQSVR